MAVDLVTSFYPIPGILGLSRYFEGLAILTFGCATSIIGDSNKNAKNQRNESDHFVEFCDRYNDSEVIVSGKNL